MKMPRNFRTWAGRCVPALVMVVILVVNSAAEAEPRNAGADTVVVIVAAASPLTEISRLHLTDLYLGRTSRFSNGTPAVPIDQSPGSADRAAFSQTYLGRSEAQIKAHWSKLIFTGRGRPPAEASNGEAARNMVARDPRAIGYLDPRLVDSTVRIVRVR